MPQLSKTELDRTFKRASKGDTPVEIHEKLMKTRKSRGELGPDLTSVRRALRGETHQRGRKETRGVKKKLTPVQLRRLNAKEKEFIRKAKKQQDVQIEDVMEAANIDSVALSIVSKHLKKKFGVQWRSPRAEPLRDASAEEERVRVCCKWKRLPNNHFTDKIDGIMDNKQWDVVTNKKGKAQH